MSVRLHMVEDAATHLGHDLTVALTRHARIQRDGGMTAQETTSAILTGLGFASTAALKLIIAFAKPEQRVPMYDEAVEKFTDVLLKSQPEVIKFAEQVND